MKKKFLVNLISFLLLGAVALPVIPVFGDNGGVMSALSDLRALGGTWNIGETITARGSGDMFALSDTEVSSFVFEADAEFKTKSGAASIVFYSGDTPSRGSYVANIDLSAGNARIFKFESAGGATTKGEYILTSEQKRNSKFNLRVESVNGYIVYYLDGQPIVRIYDTSAKPGNKLGLLDYNTSLEFTNVRYAEIAPTDLELRSLTGGPVNFDGASYSKTTVPYGTDSLTLSADLSEGSISAEIYGSVGSESVSVSGKTISVKSIEGDITLVIRVKSGEVMRSYVLDIAVEPDLNTLYNELWRPQFHFSPLKNWMNDPNGLVYDPSDGSYHLFFQYNPSGLTIANQVWGHAVSTDLIHWKELDIAIPQDYLGAVFSGSALVDEDNTSGFFTDNKAGESKLVAIFTCDGGDTTHGVEKQCIAYSKDHGVTWIRPTVAANGFENPILANDGNSFGRDFRDPKIFRYDGKWFMAVAGGRARLFTSSDLIHWTQVCDMGFDSECPDFYPLAVDGDENNVKWVYTASGKWYVVGRLEKVSDTSYKFVAEGERTTYNGGAEIYATQSYYNDGSGKNRRIAISWIQDSSASSLPGKSWNGLQSLPYEQKLVTVNGKIVLTSYPVEELNALRIEKAIDLASPTAEKVNTELSAKPGIAYDAEITFKPESGSVLTFTLRSNGSYYTTVVYDSASNMLRVVRAHSSSSTGSIPATNMEMPLYPKADGSVTVRIVMDRTVIEVFGNGGEAACGGSIFPDGDCINSGFSVSGNVQINSFEMWTMGSIWHNDAEIIAEPGLYIDTNGAQSIALSKETTLVAYLMDESGNRIDTGVSWIEPNSANITVISNENGVLTVKGAIEGKVSLKATAGDYEKTITMTVADIGFTSDLEGWSSKGDWYESADGYSINGSGGDSFAFSSGTNSGDFRYYGEATFTAGPGCLGLVFGVTAPGNPSSGTWYGANIDTHGSKPVMKLFCNMNGTEIWRETYDFTSSASVWKLEVKYENNELTYTVNGHSVTRTAKNLESGALGLVSWNGGGSFNNVTYGAIDQTGTDDPVVTTPPDGDNDPITTTPGSGTTDPTVTTTVGTGDPGTDPNNDGGNNGNSARIIKPIVAAVCAIAAAGVIAFIVISKKKKK